MAETKEFDPHDLEGEDLQRYLNGESIESILGTYGPLPVNEFMDDDDIEAGNDAAEKSANESEDEKAASEEGSDDKKTSKSKKNKKDEEDAIAAEEEKRRKIIADQMSDASLDELVKNGTISQGQAQYQKDVRNLLGSVLESNTRRTLDPDNFMSDDNQRSIRGRLLVGQLRRVQRQSAKLAADIEAERLKSQEDILLGIKKDVKHKEKESKRSVLGFVASIPLIHGVTSIIRDKIKSRSEKSAEVKSEKEVAEMAESLQEDTAVSPGKQVNPELAELVYSLRETVERMSGMIPDLVDPSKVMDEPDKDAVPKDQESVEKDKQESDEKTGQESVGEDKQESVGEDKQESDEKIGQEDLVDLDPDFPDDMYPDDYDDSVVSEEERHEAEADLEQPFDDETKDAETDPEQTSDTETEEDGMETVEETGGSKPDESVTPATAELMRTTSDETDPEKDRSNDVGIDEADI